MASQPPCVGSNKYSEGDTMTPPTSLPAVSDIPITEEHNQILESLQRFKKRAIPYVGLPAMLGVSRTPPVDISSISTTRINYNIDDKADAPQDHENLIQPRLLFPGKNATKKKRRQLKKAAPAMTTVHGFTPVASGDEDSDYSTASKSKVLAAQLSTSSSPIIRPSSSCSQGGISALRLQLEAINVSAMAKTKTKRALDSVPRSPLASPPSMNADSYSEPTSDGEASPMVSYNIPLEHDFISPDAEQKPLFESSNDAKMSPTVPQKMTASDFEPISCLGKGSFGTVLLVRQLSTGRLYAQKQFKKASLNVHHKLVEQTKSERLILESINRHPFVVKLYYAFQDHKKLYLILEYAQGGELFTHLALEKMFTEDTASFYLAEMVLALEHLHCTVGVIYRDLKPENCLLDSEGHLLLTDFGLSKVAVNKENRNGESPICNSILGTVEYMAPEVVLGREYTFAVDWWSFGALAFDLLTGSPPFPGKNHARIQEKILHQKLSLPYFLGPDAKDLMRRLLRKDPSKRLGSSNKDIPLIKNHRFFRKIDWEKLERRELEPPIKPLITDPSLAENFSTEFTDLSLSPVVRDNGFGGGLNDPFGGFSFMASSSLLQCGDGYLK
ncbi:MAG: serine/threonine protein kinase psk1 [Trizodia sp. TS-e1964]|nr:MAG: serine/threonine protein kinase psk1 [Trizodia sp. TS-e1964]